MRKKISKEETKPSPITPIKKVIKVIGIEEPLSVLVRGQSSLEIKRNSKGIAEFIIKIYGDDPEKASIKAQKIFDILNKKYKSE